MLEENHIVNLGKNFSILPPLVWGRRALIERGTKLTHSLQPNHPYATGLLFKPLKN